MDHTDPSSSTRGIARRTLFGAAAAAAGVVAAAGTAAPVQATPVQGPGPTGPGAGTARRLFRDFAKPGTATAAGFRWWWPHGSVDPRQIAREVDQIADAGFGMLEIADVTHSLRARDIEIDLTTNGWGTPAWVDGVRAALRQGARRDVRIDITVGPSWPAAVSTITPDSDAACSELAHGRVDLPGGTTYDDVVPGPLAAPVAAAAERDLVALQAFRVVSATASTTTLDPASLVDLTTEVAGGRIAWTAPEGTWVLLSYWRRGSGQEPEAGPHTTPRSWVVDHFSRAGSQAVIDLWEDCILDRELRSLLRKAGGNLFEDSLEIETHATIWTPRLLEEFQRRIGYDLLPYLPVVVEAKEKYLFAFDAVTTTRVRDDFNQLLSDLYRDNHLRVLQDFARSLGLGLRVQPYGLETDTVEHSALLDVPETESLGFKNLDDYRVMSGGRDLGGRTVLSCEAACYNGAAYNTTWDRALQTINSIYAAGVNMAVLHGFAYADAPEVTWPGFAAFSPYYNGAIGYGEAWGPRTPQWGHMSGIAGYLARTQLILQTGTPTYDIVFLRQKGWTSTGIGAQWATNDGIPRGWTHSFATAALLDLPLATVRDGRLAPDGPAYKVMIVSTDQFRGNERTIEVATARKLLRLGRAGLPIILFGDWATAEPIGLARPGETDEVRRLLAQLAALPTTRSIAADNAAIPGALADLGITPDVEHETSTVMHVRRLHDELDLYYLANAKHAENRRLQRVTQEVSLKARSAAAVPYLLDAWTGETTALGQWRREEDRIVVPVDLLPGQSTVVVLAPGHPRDVHASTTEALGVHHDGKGLVARVETAGRFVTRVAGPRGTSDVVSDVARVREPMPLGSWELTVEDWQPGGSATSTIRPLRRVTLDALVPWSQVPELADVSGIGRYRTVVDLGRDWDATRDGARLELGEVNDTFAVTINGNRLPALDVLDTTVDLGHALRRGRNVIEVEVASTLLNRLRTVTPEVYGVATRQAYGLVGPVRLVPYVDAALRV